MIRTDNLGNFFSLANEQLRRVVDHEHVCKDHALIDVVPADHHPSAEPRVRRLLDLVPPDRRVLAAAACAWFGYSQDDIVIGWAMTECLWGHGSVATMASECEALARMVDNNGITAPRDAPCRIWPMRTLERAASYDRKTADLIHGRFADILGTYTDRFLASIRRYVPGVGDWVSVSPAVARGLGWVIGSGTGLTGPDVGALVISKILDEQVQHWPGSHLVDQFDVDTVATWAAYVGAYAARRGIL